jgi:photosystem II stability/assembly factor-like uncharacterized protein
MKPGVSAVGGSGRGWVQGLARAPDGALWAVLYRATVLRSTDGGDTWTDLPSPAKCWLTDIAVAPDGAVLIGDEKGALHETRDLGQSWTHTLLRGSNTLWSVLVTPDAAMVGSGGNVFRRRHGESGWTPAKKGPRGSVVRRLSRTDDGVIFAACADMNRDRAAWRSRDGGDTWQRVLDDVSEELLGLHASGDRAYALLQSGAVMVSVDGGDSWARHALPFDARRARIWSAGRLVYALDVAPQTPAEEGVGEVWRSADAGETWTTLGPLAFTSGAVAASADGDLVVGGSVDDRGALARWRDPAVAAFFTAQPTAAPRPSVAVPSAPPTPRGPEALMLDRVLVAWRATRHPKLAVLVDSLGARCAPPSPPTAQAPWMALAQACRPEDLSALTATWLDATMDEASLRLDALLRFDDDPRVARALAAFVRDFAFGATSSKPLWTAVGAKLVALRDPHTAVVVGAASQQTIPVKGATMKAWLSRYLPKLADELDAACAPTPVLDAADRALCAEAERLLR